MWTKWTWTPRGPPWSTRMTRTPHSTATAVNSGKDLDEFGVDCESFVATKKGPKHASKRDVWQARGLAKGEGKDGSPGRSGIKKAKFKPVSMSN